MKLIQTKERYEEKDGTLFGKKNIEESLALLYHENSKFTTHSMRKQGERIAAFSNPYVAERSSQPFKTYPGREQIDLSVYGQVPREADLFEVMTRRRSVRDYREQYPLSLNELFVLLHHSYGVNYRQKMEGFGVEGHIGLRNVPSGGGLFPLEVYVVIFQSHIPNGLYHFRPDCTCLEKIKEGDFMEELLAIIQAEPYVNMRSASALIITTGMIERQLIKYGDRGYRFMMQESGFVGMMVSMLAESLDLGSCMLGGYNDDKINEFLGVDGVFETVNNLITIGKKK
ncbi:MAG: SagB family peptide dehydrogenase [Marinifilaceae bacterium]